MNFKTKNKVVIGLTGGMLSGKSTALAYFKECGAYVLSCDELVRQVSASASVKSKINHLLGGSDKEYLSQKIFDDSHARLHLEKIIHPLVFKEVAKRLKQDKTWCRVVEVPLLFEAHWADYFDLTISVYAPEKELLKRLKGRNIQKTDLLKRSIAQFPAEKKAAMADICLVNNAGTRELSEKVSALYGALRKIYQVK
ncbi:dephospho-CoA kinase [Candidatus Avelusimicrobium sp.]